MELSVGPACVLERLFEALAGLLSRRPVPGDVGSREDQLSSDPQADRQPHPLQEGGRRHRARGRQRDIIKGYEVSKGEYIEVEPEELEAVEIESKRVIDIEQFVPKDEIDELYINNPYYIVPDGEVGQQAFAVIREAIRKEGMVALAKVVFTSREHVIALEARGKGMMGVTLRYPYEVRKEEDYFDDIENERVPKDMLDLAMHIVETKKGKFEPEKFEDRYEDALKDLIKKKQKGVKIEAPKERAPSNVVNLMDALRQSVKAERGSGRRKPARTHRRAAKKAGRSTARTRKAS